MQLNANLFPVNCERKCGVIDSQRYIDSDLVMLLYVCFSFFYISFFFASVLLVHRNMVETRMSKERKKERKEKRTSDKLFHQSIRKCPESGIGRATYCFI